MSDAPASYVEGPEALIVSLAARGDRDAFTELVRRRQPWLRTLMRRFSGDLVLAGDLAQRVFLSHPEIAALTKLLLGTIKSHIRRGSLELRKLLDDYGATQ
ncbi:MAG: hypothetical protein AAFR91_02660 [Pseudomonadota bacterium]